MNYSSLIVTISVDTDSVYLNLGPVVDKFLSKQKDDKEKVVNLLDKICHDQLEPYIDKCYNELADYVNDTTRRCR